MKEKDYCVACGNHKIIKAYDSDGGYCDPCNEYRLTCEDWGL